MSRLELTLPDAAATEAFGAALGSMLRAGDTVLLTGELGAGKTTMTRGIGAALGVVGTVSSPTFVLAREHRTAAGVPLVHVDAYRLGSVTELDDLDLDLAGSITVIEWGRGLAEPLLERWLDLELVRTTGAAPQVSAASPALPGAATDSVSGAVPGPDSGAVPGADAASAADEDAELDEPRILLARPSDASWAARIRPLFSALTPPPRNRAD